MRDRLPRFHKSSEKALLDARGFLLDEADGNDETFPEEPDRAAEAVVFRACARIIESELRRRGWRPHRSPPKESIADE